MIFSALSKDEILDRRNRVRRPGATREKEETAQTSRRPFSNGRGGPQRDEVELDEEPEGDVRGDEVEIVLPTAPRRKPKPIVCHTGASTELYANPRNCRCPKS